MEALLEKEEKQALMMSNTAIGIAILILLAWLAVLGWLLLQTDATEVVWARWLTVLASLEAVAFAAAGALFGTTVQRQRVKDAADRATQAEERAEKNLEAATSGRKLSDAVIEKARREPAQGLERTSSGQSAGDLDELALLARQLFPDRP